MAEDDQTNTSGEPGDDVPRISVPSHDPLPQPPEVHYTRPNTASRTGDTATPRTEYGHTTQDAPTGPITVRYTAGLAGGVTLASSILAGYWLGSQIDTRWLHTQTPWATIVMVLAGTFVGFYNMFRLLKRGERLDRNK